MDPDLGPAFEEFYGRFDTIVVGRRTYQTLSGHGEAAGGMPGFTLVVLSNTLTPADCPGATLLSGDVKPAIARLKQAPGKDLWLFGGGRLFQSLLDMGLVDSVGVGIIPVLLGGGTPFLPAPAVRAALTLKEHRVYPKTGTVGLEYDVNVKQRGRKRTA